MTTILSIYENKGTKSQTNYSKTDVVTKHKTRLSQANYALGATPMPNLVAMESNLDLTPYNKYIK